MASQPPRSAAWARVSAESWWARAGVGSYVPLPLVREGALYDLRIRVRLAVREGRLSFRLAWLNKDDALENDAQSAAALLHGQLDDFCHVQRGVEGAGE